MQSEYNVNLLSGSHIGNMLNAANERITELLKENIKLTKENTELKHQLETLTSGELSMYLRG